MVVYALNEKEIERLDSLIKISMALYEKVHSEKSDLEFKKMIIHMENNIYSDYFNTLYKIRSAANYLKREYYEESSTTNINILSKDKKSMAIKRIISKLYHDDTITENEFYNGRPRSNSFFDEDDWGNINLIEDGFANQISTYDYSTYESHLEILEIRDWIEKSSIYLFLANLEELLNSDEGKTSKEKLLIAKNNTYFLNKWLDEDFLYYNNFKVVPNLNKPPLIFNSSIGLLPDEKYNYSFNRCYNLVKNVIDLAYMNDDKEADFLLARTYLKSYLAFLNDSDVSSLRYNVGRYILEHNIRECIKDNDKRNKRADSVRKILSK